MPVQFAVKKKRKVGAECFMGLYCKVRQDALPLPYCSDAPEALFVFIHSILTWSSRVPAAVPRYDFNQQDAAQPPKRVSSVVVIRSPLKVL